MYLINVDNKNNFEKIYNSWKIDRNKYHRLCVGESFDNHHFYYNPEISFEQAVKKWLLLMREKHKYLRLWFSGGRDSRAILDTAIKYDIILDEIAVIEYPVTSVIIGSWADVRTQAVPILKEYSKYLRKTNVVFCQCDNDFHNWFYKGNPQWFKTINSVPHYYVAPAAPASICEYSKHNLPLVDVEKEWFNIMGITTPQIWYDKNSKKWKFVYLHSQYNELGKNLDYATTGDGASVLNAYLSEIIPKFEKMNFYPEKFNGMPSRKQRFLIEYMKNIKMPKSAIMSPTHFKLDESDYPTDHKFWKYGTGGGYFVEFVLTHFLIQQDNPPSSFYHWAYETDWDSIAEESYKGGIHSYEFTFDKF